MEGAIAAWYGLWRAMTTCPSPNSLEGHSLSCWHGLSCHGFGSPILGLFILPSATATLSAARSLAELGTKGMLRVKVSACPKPHWICWSERPVSISQAPHFPVSALPALVQRISQLMPRVC